MSTIIPGRTELPISGIQGNLTFSLNEVWAWYILPIPEHEYGVYPEEAGLPRYFRENLIRLRKQAKKDELKLHLLVSTPQAGQPPIVTVGIKLGEREERGSKLLPNSFDKLVNLIADAPLNDYISDKELNFWLSKSRPYDNFFGNTVGFKLTDPNQLAYMVRKRFYPAMSIPQLLPKAEDKGQWGESNISELAKATIVPYPKYLAITQNIGEELITGYRSGVEIIKYNEDSQYPEFETWLPYVTAFPFIVDFSVRFSVTENGITNIATRISIEAGSTEELIERTDDIINHYDENDMYAVWSTGDQVALLNENIPNGKNVDADKRVKNSELSVSHIFDNITFSKNDVYAWVKLPLVQFEFLDDISKERLSYDLDVALASLIVSEEKAVECHLILQGSPFDARSWIQVLNSKIESDRPLPYNREFLTDMYQHVADSDFRNRIVLLGINIGKRTAYSPNKSVSPTLIESVLNVIPPIVTDDVSEQELEYWKVPARQITSALQNSRVRAIPAEAKELAFSVRKNFFPEMPLPSPDDLAVGTSEVWRKEEINYLADSKIENHSKYLKISQMIDGELVTGYRATLCFSRFPETMVFPQGDPWIHSASMLNFPTDFSLRFTVEPARKVRKEVGKKLKEIVDQAINMEGAGGNSTIEVQTQIMQGEDLEYTLKQDPSPWVYGRYRITVEASSVEELKEKAKQIIDHYRGMEIYVTWPTGDQLALLKEGLPNDRVRSKAYYQRHTLPGISAGIPAGTGTAGDALDLSPQGEVRGWIGPYLGYTTGQTQDPVFLSMHSTIDTNNANGLAITGSPGGGKTFCALTLTYQAVLAGSWVIYIDPKADAKNITSLPGLAQKSKVLDLRNGNAGILDPFSIGTTTATQIDLAIEVIYLFLGGLDKITEEQQVQLSLAVERVTTLRKDPSLGMIVDFLINSVNLSARSLGAKLDILRKLPFAQLCFTQGQNTMKLRPEDGLTVLTLEGLDLPAASVDRDGFTNANRLAVGVMYLLSSFTKDLMRNSDKSHAKTIIIDEAWAITSTEQGKKLINEVARMGRAHNTSLILVSQNAADFAGDGITNSVSTRLCFRAKDPGEIDQVLSFLQMEHSDSNRDTVRNLHNGECLLRDWSGRIAKIQIDGWDEKMRKAFETNPRSKASNEAA
jgi:hypothetical protein